MALFRGLCLPNLCNEMSLVGVSCGLPTSSCLALGVSR